MIGAYVNDKYVPVDYQLKNKDRVRILVDSLAFGPRYEWLEQAKTAYAKRRIKDFYKKITTF